ncbi:Myb-like DNA-binding domain containing protein, partial [Aphelenchoides avenae]
ALYELYRQQWDIRAAEQHLSAVVKEDREWSEADKRFFDVGFTTFGKEFDKIRLLLPHKPLGAVVKHYYDTKKLQFYRTFTPEESGEVDNIMPVESGVNSCNEGANDREDACVGCLTVVDCQVVPHKSPVSNLSDDMENMEMQADNDVQRLARPAKRSSSAAEDPSGAKNPKKVIECLNREGHASVEPLAMEPIKVRRFMRMNQEKLKEVISKEQTGNMSESDESLVLHDDVEIICLDDV